MNPLKVKEVTPLEIAPEEIWLYIFDLLDTNDLVEVSLSCRSFSDFLQKKKVSFLFGNILPIIATSLDTNSLLACRGVSKQWRVETDKFFESRGVTHICDLDTEAGRNRYAARSLCPLFNMETMPQFHQSMKDHPTNPFVGRTVELYFQEDEFPPVVKDTVQLFIETFGQHIWHFDYNEKSEPENNEDIMTLGGAYRLFKNIADTMPNIRSIHLSIDSLINDPEDVIPEDNRLIDLMAANPLPDLPFLEMLKLQFGDPVVDDDLSLHCPFKCGNIYSNIYRAYGHQLKRLDIQWFHWIPFFPLENLTELRLHSFGSNVSLEWLKNCVTSTPSSPTEISLPSLIRLETEFNYYKLDVDCFMIFLQVVRETCGGLEILRLSLYIAPIAADAVGTIIHEDIVFAQKPVDYDSEDEWLRHMISGLVERAEQTRLDDLGQTVTGP